MKRIRLTVLVAAAFVVICGIGYLGLSGLERPRTVLLTSDSIARSPKPVLPSPTPTLNAPAGAPMAYGWDGVDGRMMISTVLRDGLSHLDSGTWTFDGAGWISMATPPAATKGTNRVLGFDSKRHRMVVVMTVEESVGEAVQTWEWDGASWTLARTAHSPQLSQWSSAAYSPDLGATVLLGIRTAPPYSTWLYNGSDWRRVVTAHQPARGYLEYDETRKSIVALGPDDFRTWRFNGVDWTRLPLHGPTPAVSSSEGRQAPSIGLDQARDTWVVFGGFDGYATLHDTWTGNGTTWTKQAPNSAPISLLGIPGKDNLAWDPIGARLLLFGGVTSFSGQDTGDTWAWDGVSWTLLGSSAIVEP